MINPFEMLLGKARNSQAMQGLSQAAGMAQMAQNPGTIMSGIGQMLLRNNPNYQRAMDYIQQNGGNPQQAFANLVEEARAMGIQNPESALDQARNAINNQK